ncbi:MAG: C39 family peptidase [Nanoarchaeota archaeon]|nr:C39 family peptidase [Nanoarchaeota archaeon]
MIEKVFRKQKKDHTCGPASMGMLLKAVGIDESEEELSRMLKTSEAHGTLPAEFPRLAEKYKLNYLVRRNSDFEDLDHLKKRKYLVILIYHIRKEKIDHYAVFKKIENGRIYLFDPWFGKNKSYSLNYFFNVWKSSEIYGGEKRWLFAIKKEV